MTPAPRPPHTVGGKGGRGTLWHPLAPPSTCHGSHPWGRRRASSQPAHPRGPARRHSRHQGPAPHHPRPSPHGPTPPPHTAARGLTCSPHPTTSRQAGKSAPGSTDTGQLVGEGGQHASGGALALRGAWRHKGRMHPVGGLWGGARPDPQAPSPPRHHRDPGAPMGLGGVCKSYVPYPAGGLGGCDCGHKSVGARDEPQRIVAARLLCRLQYPVPYLSRLQRIYLPAHLKFSSETSTRRHHPNRRGRSSLHVFSGAHGPPLPRIG